MPPLQVIIMFSKLDAEFATKSAALKLRGLRQEVIASNIANADTPGYQARDMDFSRALKAATGEISQPTALVQTQAGHLGSPGGASGDAALTYSLPSQTSLDSNSVDMDRERASFVDNSVKYEATLTFIGGQVRNLMDAMKPSTGS